MLRAEGGDELSTFLTSANDWAFMGPIRISTAVFYRDFAVIRTGVNGHQLAESSSGSYWPAMYPYGCSESWRQHLLAIA